MKNSLRISLVISIFAGLSSCATQAGGVRVVFSQDAEGDGVTFPKMKTFVEEVLEFDCTNKYNQETFISCSKKVAHPAEQVHSLYLINEQDAVVVSVPYTSGFFVVLQQPGYSKLFQADVVSLLGDLQKLGEAEVSISRFPSTENLSPIKVNLSEFKLSAFVGTSPSR